MLIIFYAGQKQGICGRPLFPIAQRRNASRGLCSAILRNNFRFGLRTITRFSIWSFMHFEALELYFLIF